MQVFRRIAEALPKFGGKIGRAELRRRIFYIDCPNYSHLSSGIRSLYLLCDHLNRLGCQAYVTGTGCPENLSAPRIEFNAIEANRRNGLDDIVVYPEVVAGN